MANTIDIKVPDIGGHDNVPVIEVLVRQLLRRYARRPRIARVAAAGGCR
jgi:hypothetical protein